MRHWISQSFYMALHSFWSKSSRSFAGIKKVKESLTYNQPFGNFSIEKNFKLDLQKIIVVL